MKPVVRIAFIILILLSMGYKRYHPYHSDEITREHLVWFVQEAQEFIKIYGKEEALREFNNPKGLFVRGELYIHASDFNCKVLALGGNPSLKGSDFSNLEDINGIKICKSKIEKLKNSQSGWLDHTMVNHKTNQIMGKLSYYERVDNEDWYISAGMYYEK
jgi:cytochrome c